MTIDKNDIHVVVLPWLAFGHMLPMLHLSIDLANHGVRVSYISTPRNIARLPKIPPNIASLIQYVSLPMPKVPNGSSLPGGAEATTDVELDEIPLLKKAYDLLYEPVKNIVSTHLPTWIISDFAAYWVAQISEECQVQLMYFSVFNATTMFVCITPEETISGEGQETAPSEVAVSPSLALQYYEATQLRHELHSNNASGITDIERWCKVLKGSRAIGIRSCREIEGDTIDLLQSLNNKLVVPVGMLPPAKVVKQESENGLWDEVFKWLDRQTQGSVIYVGFGSEHKLTKDQVYEIAYGLELAQLPFIWFLRKPTWAVDEIQSLPPNFKNRISHKGLVCIGWGPQLEILAHPSVGGSLFHSGWGSIIETLQHGHTPILLPFVHDQGINARIMVQKGLGIQIQQRQDGSFTRNDIAHALTTSMLGDQAQKIKACAKQAAGFFGNPDWQSQHYVSGFVQFLIENPRVKI